jgi:NTP pyrophosphatase (non-canonical NTP hydrolase)
MTDEEFASFVQNEWQSLIVIVEQCRRDNIAWKCDELDMDPLTYHVLGIAGEAGEVANKFKKLARPGWNTPENVAKVVEEMADTLTHLCAAAALLNLDLAAAFWEKREINLRRFGEGSSDQSGIATGVRRQQSGALGAAAFVRERDVQIKVQP